VEVSRQASLGVLIAAAIVFPVLFFVAAPYGRHARPGWGPTVPAKVGWLVMEAPSFFLFGAAWLFSPDFGTLTVTLLGVAWLVHYGQRTFVYPALMRGGGKGKPLLTVAMAIAFNVANALGNGAQLRARELDLPLVAGLSLFAGGLALNLQSDAVLRGLRQPGETGYAVPHGGLHRYVASPNYLGEILEWLGFAIAAQTLAGWAFFAFTCANLVPRARSHRQWYRATFPDYPPRRRALIPFLW
jgi:protein-S-isoprenylcysteine O-methyltransferase Ste14